MTKPIISAIHAINWYYGNFLLSQNNALRDIDEDKYLKDSHELVDRLKIELTDQRMTHQQFIDLMREKGIHAKYYKYQKLKPTNCKL